MPAAGGCGVAMSRASGLLEELSLLSACCRPSTATSTKEPSPTATGTKPAAEQSALLHSPTFPYDPHLLLLSIKALNLNVKIKIIYFSYPSRDKINHKI
jgi:hypothetical protein